jgi:hypothetical protein
LTKADAEQLSEAWWNTLAVFEVGEYKSSDCEYGREQFTSWPKDRRNCLTKQMIEIIEPQRAPIPSPVIFGVGTTAVRVDRSPSIDNPKPQLTYNEIKLSYGYCFQQTLALLVDELERLEISEDVAIVIDESDYFGYLYEIYKSVRKSHPQLVTMSQEPSVAFAPLQAADLLTYNASKILYLHDQIPQLRHLGRKSLERLGKRLKLEFAIHRGDPIQGRFQTEFIYDYWRPETES